MLDLLGLILSEIDVGIFLKFFVLCLFFLVVFIFESGPSGLFFFLSEKGPQFRFGLCLSRFSFFDHSISDIDVPSDDIDEGFLMD